MSTAVAVLLVAFVAAALPGRPAGSAQVIDVPNLVSVDQVQLDSSGRLLASGARDGGSIGIVRYVRLPTPDPSFGSAGHVAVPVPADVAVDRVEGLAVADQRIIALVGHIFPEETVLALAESDGSAVAGFGTHGSAKPLVCGGAIDGQAHASSGVIWAADLADGECSGTHVAKLDLTTGAQLGERFAWVLGPEGGDFFASAMALDQEGRPLLVGFEGTVSGSKWRVLRLAPDITLDTTFGISGAATLNEPFVSGFDTLNASLVDPYRYIQRTVHLTVDSTGRIVVAGLTTPGNTADPPWDLTVVRLLPTGQLDTSFGNGGVAHAGLNLSTGVPMGITVLVDGRDRIVVAASADAIDKTYAVVFDDSGAADPLVGPGGLVAADASFNVTSGVLVPGELGGPMSRSATAPHDTLVLGGVTDAGGGALLPIALAVPNGVPVATDDRAEVLEGGTVAGNVLTNDRDPDGDPLTAIKLSDPAHGTVTLNADGSFTYVHDGSETTTDSFRYRASDGVDQSAPATVSITIELTPTTVGLVDPSQGRWHLRDEAGGVSSFFFGNPGDTPVMGDWDCDGTDTPGLFRTSDAFAYLSNANRSQIADIRFFFGDPSDIPLAGDFDGNGCDTLSIYRPSEGRFYIVNKLGQDEGGLGPADFSFGFGNLGDKPVVGDWDGDGIDEIGLHRESTGLFYWRNTLSTGIADGQIIFGDPGDRFVAGDWGVVDGTDTPAVFRPSGASFYLRHTLTQGVADESFAFGEAPWLPVAGEFGTS